MTIRLIDFLEREQERTGVNLTQNRGLVLVENEAAFYRNLSQILLKVIAVFRKQLIFDQMEVSPLKLKLKHNYPHMPSTAATTYTPPELLAIKDDLIDIKVDDTNYDMFNKESVILGLLLVTRKLKKMPAEQAIYIQEAVSQSI